MLYLKVVLNTQYPVINMIVKSYFYIQNTFNSSIARTFPVNKYHFILKRSWFCKIDSPFHDYIINYF